MTSRWSLQARATAGAAGGDDLPFHYRSSWGAPCPSAVFAERQPVVSRPAGAGTVGPRRPGVAAGAQFELSAGLYVTGRAHVGNTGERWQWVFDDYRRGYEVAFGAASMLGPLEVVVSSAGRRPRLEVRLGRVF